MWHLYNYLSNLWYTQILLFLSDFVECGWDLSRCDFRIGVGLNRQMRRLGCYGASLFYPQPQPFGGFLFLNFFFSHNNSVSSNSSRVTMILFWMCQGKTFQCVKKSIDLVYVACHRKEFPPFNWNYNAMFNEGSYPNGKKYGTFFWPKPNGTTKFWKIKNFQEKNLNYLIFPRCCCCLKYSEQECDFEIKVDTDVGKLWFGNGNDQLWLATEELLEVSEKNQSKIPTGHRFCKCCSHPETPLENTNGWQPFLLTNWLKL